MDWNRPALPAAAVWLIDQYAMMGAADLSNVVVVVPGRRAGRRLTELLIEEADRRQIRLTPPPVETAGRLPERLYKARRRFASDLINKFAWTAALRKLDEAQLHTVIPDPPRDHDLSRWLSFGELLWKQHRELAAEGLDFQDVITQGEGIAEFDEAERWKVLRRVQESCLAMLDDLELWDLQSARLFAIKHEECTTTSDIILVGTADLNLATREMLEKVADRVTALVHAPVGMQKRFDAFGCIAPDAWAGCRVDLADDQFCVCEGPADQAAEVVRTLADYDGQYRIDDVTIGVADENLVPEIQRILADHGAPTRWVVGQQLNESRPYRLLKAVADYLESEQFDAFASLVRHCDLDAWICRLSDTNEQRAGEGANGTAKRKRQWLHQLDSYFNDFLPSKLEAWPQDHEATTELQAVHAAVTELLHPLLDQKRSLAEWVQPITQLLMTVYSDVEFDVERAADSYALHACRKIHELLLTHEDIPEMLMPRVAAAQAIRLLLTELHDDCVPPPPDDSAMEILGWLELPLDDAPALIVTTFNDGFVPAALNSDAFLPNTMRRHLGLVDNKRRYARDAYALSVLMASRRQIRLITGRRDVRGDPLRPSRLLFAADEKQIAERVLKCFDDESQGPAREDVAAMPENRTVSRDANVRRLQLPRPQPLQRPIERMSVTAFRTYLACPYRFYLQQVLRLRAIDDTASELNAMKFGNIMHDVLHRFGTGSLKESRNAADIRTELRRLLAAVADEELANSRLAAVNVQLRQIEKRLDAFAEWQAGWARQGWVIRYSEVSFQDRNVQLMLDGGRSIQLDGRIDRIDQLAGTNRYTIFDYKSGESARDPKRAHLKRDEWVDLQLPLYHYMVRQIGITGELDLGYITLPKDTEHVQHCIAGFSEGELSDAVSKASSVAMAVVNERFWPPQDIGPLLYSEFSPICQEGAFDREVIA